MLFGYINRHVAVMPAFGVLAAVFFMVGARCYDHDVRQVEGIRLDAVPTQAA